MDRFPQQPQDTEDKQRLDQLRDTPVFDNYFLTLYGQAVGLARHLTHSIHQAEDIAAEVMVKIWRRSQGSSSLFSENTDRNPDLRAYAMRAVYHRVIDLTRQNTTRYEIPSEIIDQINAAQSPSAEQDSDFFRILRLAMETPGVTPEMVETLYVTVFEGIKGDDAAKLLQVKPGTIKSRMNTMRQRLQQNPELMALAQEYGVGIKSDDDQ